MTRKKRNDMNTQFDPQTKISKWQGLSEPTLKLGFSFGWFKLDYSENAQFPLLSELNGFEKESKNEKLK